MEKELREFGFSVYESRALLLLFSKKLTLRQLSNESRIPFGKIYSVVKNLKKKGLIEETNSRPKLVYVENASEVIAKMIAKREREKNTIKDRLKLFASKLDIANKRETQFFQIGTCIEDNQKIQLRSFTEARGEILQILNIHHKPKSNRSSKKLWEKAIMESVKRGVVFKAIYPKNLELPSILKKLNGEEPTKFQIRRFDTDFIRCDIIDADKVLVKLVYQDPLQFGGVFFVDNKKLNQNLRKIFYEIWNSAE